MNCSIKIYRNNVIVYYQKNKSVCRFSTGLKIKPVLKNKKFVDWNYQKERFKAHVPNAELNNKTLDSLENKANKIISDFLAKGITANGANVKAEMVKRMNESEEIALKTFLDFYENFYSDKEKRITQSNNKSNSSLKDYKTFQNTIVDYVQEFGDFQLSDLNENWLIDFKSWLARTRPEGSKTKGGLNSKTIRKRLDVFKTFIFWLKKHEIIDKVEIIKEACKEHKVEDADFDTLTIEEVRNFYNKDLGSTRLNQIRDVFVFSCYSSLRYQDLKDLRKEHIFENFIQKLAHKTRNNSNAPYHVVELNKVTKEIIERYNYKLPVLTNPKCNDYIKEAFKKSELFKRRSNRKAKDGRILKLEDAIVMHDARRTFISNMVNETDSKMHEIMKMSAHTKLETLNKYIDKTRDLPKGATNQLL